MPKATPKKPKKPRKDFPLTPHPKGRWCKKIGGKLYYFGSWSDPNGALQEYLAIKEELQGGIDPRTQSCTRAGTTTGEAVNLFLERCDKRVQLGELSGVSFLDYKIIGSLIIQHLGRNREVSHIQPDDFTRFRFAMSEAYSPSRLSKTVAVTRMIFKWAYESRIIDRMPIFGPDFSTVSKKQKRIHRANSPKKLFTADEIKKLIDAADAKWKAIIMLGVNCGFGNSDISRITLDDVAGAWIDLPRGKTGIDRRIPLWGETQAAIKGAVAARVTPKPEVEQLLFLSGHGGPLIKIREEGKRTDLTIEGFRRLAKRSGIYREGMGLYWLRHTFQTVGDGARDPVATSAIMGHADSSMAWQYRESIDDERLRAVTNHVHSWLFSDKTNKTV